MPDQPQTFRLGAGVQLSVSLQRLSSRTSPPETDIGISQLTERGMVIDVPRETCSQGERVRLLIEARASGGLSPAPPPPVQVTVDARVTRLHTEGRKSARESVEIEFVNHDPEVWGKVRGAMSGWQEEVTRVFKAMRGRG